MKRMDREDALARALDILPPGDPAGSDPRLVRNAEMLEESRSAREAVADVWLAVSPLTAAPSDVLNSVMKKVDGDRKPSSAEKRSFAPWLLASGWAAAAAITIILWPRAETEFSEPFAQLPADSSGESNPRPSSNSPVNDARSRSAPRHNRELEALRRTVARLTSAGGTTTPRVMNLVAPGSAARSPEETQDRVRQLLLAALRQSLELESGAPHDPASLVIERGWWPEGFSLTDDSATLRHRNFPEDSWQDYGLLKGDDDTYYDPVNEFLWTRDSARGGFVGQKETELDLAPFLQAEDIDPDPGPTQRTQPEGFVIEDPLTNRAQIIIDQIPVPAEGSEQLIVWTDTSGAVTTASLAELVDDSGTVGSEEVFNTQRGSAVADFSSVGDLLQSGTISFSVANSGGLTSFQLVERPLVPNGTPDRVIVSGGN